MLSHIKVFDHFLFNKINQVWSNAVFDFVLPPLRDAKFWIPLYIILLIYGIHSLKKKVIFWVLLVATAIGTSDQLGMLIKNSVQRLRPCQVAQQAATVRLLLERCPSSYSFISNHAVNHFTFAIFIVLTLPFRRRLFSWLFILWAGIIGYAQVYVGVHYPIDVLCGAFVGCALGYSFGYIFNKYGHKIFT